MSALLLAKAAPYIAALVALIAALLGLRAGIRKDAKRETALQAAERYAKQRKAIDDADTGVGATDLQRIKRLREFAEGKP